MKRKRREEDAQQEKPFQKAHWDDSHYKPRYPSEDAAFWVRKTRETFYVFGREAGNKLHSSKSCPFCIRFGIADNHFYKTNSTPCDKENLDLRCEECFLEEKYDTRVPLEPEDDRSTPLSKRWLQYCDDFEHKSGYIHFILAGPDRLLCNVLIPLARYQDYFSESEPRCDRNLLLLKKQDKAVLPVLRTYYDTSNMLLTKIGVMDLVRLVLSYADGVFVVHDLLAKPSAEYHGRTPKYFFLAYDDKT
jgi:hypothetical protein